MTALRLEGRCPIDYGDLFAMHSSMTIDAWGTHESAMREWFLPQVTCTSALNKQSV